MNRYSTQPVDALHRQHRFLRRATPVCWLERISRSPVRSKVCAQKTTGPTYKPILCICLLHVIQPFFFLRRLPWINIDVHVHSLPKKWCHWGIEFVTRAWASFNASVPELDQMQSEFQNVLWKASEKQSCNEYCSQDCCENWFEKLIWVMSRFHVQQQKTPEWATDLNRTANRHTVSTMPPQLCFEQGWLRMCWIFPAT